MRAVPLHQLPRNSIVGQSDPLLLALGPVDGAHALVIGGAALPTLCALIGGGCAGATQVSLHERPVALPEQVEFALVPRVESLAEAATAAALASRALMTGGSIALRDASGGLAPAIADLLRRHGFRAVRVRADADGAIVTGQRPLLAPLRRA